MTVGLFNSNVSQVDVCDPTHVVFATFNKPFAVLVPYEEYVALRQQNQPSLGLVRRDEEDVQRLLKCTGGRHYRPFPRDIAPLPKCSVCESEMREVPELVLVPRGAWENR